MSAPGEDGRPSERHAPSRGAVLVGFAESLAAPETAWSLLDAGFEVVAFAREAACPALRHCRSVALRRVPAPEEDLAGSLDALDRLAREVKPAAVMPLDDASLWLVDRLGERLDAPVVGATGETAALALDRSRQLDAARAAGFDVPPSELHRSPAEALAREGAYPVVARAVAVVAEREGRLMRRPARPCADRGELEQALAQYGPDQAVLLQPLVDGAGEGLFAIATPRLQAVSAHRRIRMMNPEGSGSSACVSTEVEPGLRAAAARLTEDAGWRGMIMFELLRDPSGRAWFIELNGRPWGSMALARRTGLEYPAWSTRLRLEPGFRPPDHPPRTGVVCRHAGRDLAHLAQVLRGPRSRSSTGRWPSRLRTAREVLTVRRGDHWYNWRRDAPLVFASDTIGALRSALGRGNR